MMLLGDFPEARVGVPYIANLIADGGTAPYTWTISKGQLPPGLELTDLGYVVGVPQESGTFQFTVHVHDAGDEAAELNISVCDRY